MPCRIRIAVEDQALQRLREAEELAHQLGASLIAPNEAGCDLELAITSRRVELREVGRKTGPVYVDWIGGPTGRRTRTGGIARDPLIRAIGRREDPYDIVDATAGLGRDAFLLAVSGCRVTMVERSAVLTVLLEDGLRRAALDSSVGPVVANRMQLVQADARRYLADLPEALRPDAVYIDPMFPQRAKTALSKKEMRICRMVAGDDPDAGELLEVARRVACRRVVVKRWLHAPPLADRPAMEYKGRSIRYDVYLC